MIEKAELLSIENDRLRRTATYASIGVAIVLIAAKLAAYFLTDSVAMLSSLLDSTIDLLASLVTAYGVASALRPPDREHRFGHGKAEPLAALTQAAFIVGSSVLLAYQALYRLYSPQPIQNENFGYAVMALGIALGGSLIWFQHYVVRRTNSLAIGADRLHYTGDLVVNIGVVAAFALHQMTGIDWFDPLFALAIAGGLIFSAYRIAVEALNVLMDRELPDEARERIKSIVRAQAAVRGIHDMRTRSDSDRIFVELHVELDPEMTLRKAHVIAEAIEEAICKEFPNADILIHEDPAGLTEPRLDQQIAARATSQ
jgi:ferrous-iron efflux pump FieF